MSGGALVPKGPVEILPAGSPVGQAIKVGRRGFEYLGKNGDRSIGVMIKLLVLLFGAGLVWYNIDAIHHFVDMAVRTQTLLLKGGIVAAAMWVFWLIVSNKRLHYLVAQMVDQTIEGIHMWWINRNPQKAALYSIGRLRGLVARAAQAKGVIYGVLEKEDAAIASHKEAAEDALQGAKGFEREIERRTSGSGRAPSADVVKLTNEQVGQMLQLAKAKLHQHYEFYTNELKDRAKLAQQAEQIKIIIDAITAQISKFETDLQIEQQRWELAREKLIAAQAAADVLSGPEYQDFQMALTRIKDEAFAFEGQVRRYMDQLDPTVRSYQTGQAASAIADDEFYRNFADVLGTDESSMKSRVQAALPAHESMPDVEELLGTGESRKAAPVSAATAAKDGSGRSTSFDNLLGGRRRRQ